MKLRQLELKDAPLMLEWMHDVDVTKNLRADFATKTVTDCEGFIKASEGISKSIHLAVVSDDDEYMGTVSLKNVDLDRKIAEFGITIRKCAMGHGYAWYGMAEIIRKAFVEYELECVYWCVSMDNVRAVRFYDKHDFHEAVDVPKEILEEYSDTFNLKWYSISNCYVVENRTTNCWV